MWPKIFKRDMNEVIYKYCVCGHRFELKEVWDGEQMRYVYADSIVYQLEIVCPECGMKRRCNCLSDFSNG